MIIVYSYLDQFAILSASGVLTYFIGPPISVVGEGLTLTITDITTVRNMVSLTTDRIITPLTTERTITEI